MPGQLVKYQEIEAKLAKIIGDGESTKSNLGAIDALIQETVGASGVAWAGDSAMQFKASWDELAAEIPTFVENVEKQAKNVQVLLAKARAADANGAVPANSNISTEQPQ